jgi:hypothetical protein
LLNKALQVWQKCAQRYFNLADVFLNIIVANKAVQKVADNINDVEEFGDLPPQLLHRLSQILCKRRVLTPRTLQLFLRSEFDAINIYDCGSE